MSPYDRDLAATRGLGRRRPSTWTHVERHPLTAVEAPGPTVQVENLVTPPEPVRLFFNQGQTGACTGYSTGMQQATRHLIAGKTDVLVDPKWAWQWARLHDEWSDNDDLSDDDQGTSVHAAYDAWRLRGGRHVTPRSSLGLRSASGRERPVSHKYGIVENQWATNVDGVRAAIAANEPVVLGINWYSAFDSPHQKPDGHWWAGDGGSLGSIRGGHAIGVYGWSDRYDAGAVVNSWGADYPAVVWLPRTVIERLISEDGEAAVVTKES